MRLSWRYVSALLVLLAMLASACGSEPTEVVVGSDDLAEAAPDLDESDETTDVAGDTGDAGASLDAVGNDSVPIEVPTEQQAALFEATEEAKIRWDAADVSDYDFSVAFVGARESGFLQVEVRDGEVTRFIGSGDLDEGLDIADLFESIPEAIDGSEQDGINDVSFDHDLGYPTRISGFDSGQPASLEIYRFRTADEYPDACSADGLTYPGPSGDDPVSVTRRALLEAAQQCDYLMLSHLADQSSEEVTFSFGGGGVETLWQAEKAGDLRLGILAELLAVEPTVIDGGISVWPEAYADPDLEYYDWRVGISAEGEWLFFVAGD